MTAKKSAKQRPLAERVQALKTEVEAEIDRLAEERRPKGPNGLPAGSLRLMWMGKGGNLFDAYLLAGEKAMEVEWIEHSLEMLKLIAHLEPRQLKYEGVAAGLSDEQLAAVEAVLIEAQAQIVDAKPQALEAPEEKPGRIKVIGVSRHEKESLSRS